LHDEVQTHVNSSPIAAKGNADFSASIGLTPFVHKLSQLIEPMFESGINNEGLNVVRATI
jgi:hypothetical protein